MRKFMTSTFAVIFAVGTISVLHTTANSCSNDINPMISVCKTGFNHCSKEDVVNRINDIESLMKAETKNICEEIDKKRYEYQKLIKDKNVSSSQREKLKADFISDNKDLLNKLDEIRKPYIEEIKKIHKNYVDNIFVIDN